MNELGLKAAGSGVHHPNPQTMRGKKNIVIAGWK
jgi:hypothetical protein